jgi:predicted DCC family thiol-disulfide oxidoreductase YuxK
MPRTIDDAPDRLILFDGVCVLCSWWVRFVIERDTGARFRFVGAPVSSMSSFASVDTRT